MDFLNAVTSMAKLMDGSAVREARDMWCSYRVATPESGDVPRPSDQFEGSVADALNANSKTVVGQALANCASGQRAPLYLERRDGVAGFPQAQALARVSLDEVADRLQDLSERGNATALLAAGALLPPTITAGMNNQAWVRAGLKLNPESAEYLKKGDHVGVDDRMPSPPKNLPGGYVGGFQNADGKALVEIHQKPDLSDPPQLSSVLWVAKDAAHRVAPPSLAAPPPSPAAPATPAADAAPAAPAAAAAEQKTEPAQPEMSIDDRLKKIDNRV
ncbi:MAG: hypothetical protein ACYCW6_24935, partial [Candidatus Xenobia bacterium]